MSEAQNVSETKPELSLVFPNDIIFCDPGDDVVLSCNLKPAISAISMEIKLWNKEDLVCHYKDGQMIESYEGRVSLSLLDLHNGNVSLTLRDVRRSQRGNYICEVIHECQTIKQNIFLHISSEDFSLVVSNGIVSAEPGEDVILPVHLSPETSAVSMNIQWFRESEVIYQFKNGKEQTCINHENRVSLSIQELERGNLSLMLRNVQESDSGIYKCYVSRDGCLQTVELQLRVSDDDAVPEAVEEQRSTTKRKTKDLKWDGPIKKLKQEISIMVLDLKRQINKPTLPTHVLHGPTPRRRNSMDGIFPTMSDDDTLEPKTEEEKETRHTMVSRGDEGTRGGSEENRATEQESLCTSSHALQAGVVHQQSRHPSRTILPWPSAWSCSPQSETGISPASARKHAQENPGATNIQERIQESESTGQERSSLVAIQSQVQEETTSQSVTSLPGDTTNTRDEEVQQKKKGN